METKELTKEELQAKYDSLLAEFNKMKEDKDFWFESHRKLKTKFDNFKNMIKGLVVLVE